MDIRKKRAAAIAAVVEYIRSEEEIAAASHSAAIPVQLEKRTSLAGLWGSSGRQSMMQMRNLMQLRSFHGVGLR